jgi:3-methyladenine DNA glycosylase AlkD
VGKPVKKPAASKKPARAKKPPTAKASAVRDVEAVLRELKRHASAKFRADMSARYGIVTKDETFGTPMAKIKAIAKPLGKDHAFAEALWRTGVYEARILVSMVGEPERLTPAQMDRWAKDFDNWGVVDTLCFNLFDRSPHAFSQIRKWARAKDEYVRRGAFALLACTALHGHGEDADFLEALALVERASTDDRNFVKKGVSWALRAIGGKKSPKLRAAARELAGELSRSADRTARWIGKDALRAFAKG